MTSDTPARGRPQDEARTTAILAATHEVMRSQGWTDLKVSDIATTAGCGLATIYRRWETKEDLVAAAMRARPMPPVDETGDPRTDLHNLVAAVAEDCQAMGEGTIGFLAATNSDPELRAAFEEGVMGVARPRFAEHLERLLGQDSPHIDIIIDGMAGAMILRCGVLRTFESPAAFADEVLAVVDVLAAQS